MKKLISLFACLCLLQACAVRGIGGSYVGDLPQQDVIAKIANDMATYISEIIAPGHNPLSLLTPKKDAENEFSVSFENALRTKGFEISATGEISIAYTIDSLDDESFYVQVRFSDGVAIARSYNADGVAEAGRTKTLEVPYSRSKKMKEKAEETVHTIYGMEQ